MKRNSHLPLAIAAVLGSAVALTACHATGPGAAGLSPSATVTPASHSVTAGSQPATGSPVPATAPTAQMTPPSAASPTAPASPAAPTGAGAVVTRVVANCSVAPDTLAVRPKGIVIACADGNLGVEKMSWASWGASTATGRGTLYENQCEPNCAEGKFATYQVAVTLSTVKSSSQGAWFSELAVTWEGARPSNATPDRFPLMPPRRI
jgi:hypothetical protein